MSRPGQSPRSVSARFVVGAGHGHVLVPGGAPIMLIAGIVMVIIGLTVILRPQLFGATSVWSLGQPPPQRQGPIYTFTNRLIGASFCIFGLVSFIIAIVNL